MATDSSLHPTIFEKISDRVIGFVGGFTRIVSWLFGAGNEQQIRKLGYIRTRDLEKPYTVTPGSLLAQMNEFEPKMQALSDADLKGLSTQFRERLKGRETLED